MLRITDTGPRVVSVNVGVVQAVEWRGRTVTTGIFKHAVAGRVALSGVNFHGDNQADRTVHGGPDKSVYAYALEDYAAWRAAEGIATPAGLFGENLTVQGLDLSEAVIGQQWRVGSAVLAIVQPRLPCFKLGIRMGDAQFPSRFLAMARTGAYLRIIQEGDVGAGDDVHVVDTPAHGVRLRDMVDAMHDPAKAAKLRQVPYLPKFWREVAEAE